MRHGVSEVYGKAVGPFLDEHEALELEAADPSEHDKLGKSIQRIDGIRTIFIEYQYLSLWPCLAATRTSLSCCKRTVRKYFPAAWSFMLALRVRGLGACWTSLHIEHEEETAALLGIPKNVTQAALLPIGYYKGKRF